MHLDSKDTFSAAEDVHLKGSITLEAWKKQMIHDLLDDDQLVLYAMCYIDDIDSIQRSSKKFQQVECRLTITVYGSVEDTTEVGDWFQQYEVYLQDPLVCHQNTPYYNPHRLSSENRSTCLTVAEVVDQSTSHIQLQDINSGLDMLDLLSSRQILDEAQQPKAILSPLKRWVSPVNKFTFAVSDLFWHCIGTRSKLLHLCFVESKVGELKTATPMFGERLITTLAKDCK